MKNHRLLKKIQPWLEGELGASIDRLARPSAAVLTTEPRSEGDRPFWAVRVEGQGMVTVSEEWLGQVQSVVSTLSLDELFTVFGAYEVARVTLPRGTAVFGPSWYLAADADSFISAGDTRPVQLAREDLATTVDSAIFWHCSLQQAAVAHAIFEENRLVALATTRLRGDLVYEIAVDVAPQAKSQGLGRAVVSAAGEWILEQGGLILAVSAPWNVPSVRTMRSLGLRLVLTDMTASRPPLGCHLSPWEYLTAVPRSLTTIPAGR